MTKIDDSTKSESAEQRGAKLRADQIAKIANECPNLGKRHQNSYTKTGMDSSKETIDSIIDTMAVAASG